MLLLPVTVAGIVPLLLLEEHRPDWPLAVDAAGLGLLAAGAGLLGVTIRHFADQGRGTLAPWDPPRRLVVSGVYRHVRNPMISGVFLVLVGESLLFASAAITLWTAGFAVANAVYMPLVEEPALRRRFGEEYATYARHVPRWVPRLTPWRPGPPPSGDRSRSSITRS